MNGGGQCAEIQDKLDKPTAEAGAAACGFDRFQSSTSSFSARN